MKRRTATSSKTRRSISAIYSASRGTSRQAAAKWIIDRLEACRQHRTGRLCSAVFAVEARDLRCGRRGNMVMLKSRWINNRLRRHTRHRQDCPWTRLGAGRTPKRLEGQLAGDDFLERNIGKRHPRSRLHHGPMSQTELSDALGDNVDQKLLIWDNLGCFLEKLSRHMAQGTDGAGCFRRELKNGRHADCESGWGKLRCEHGKT